MKAIVLAAGKGTRLQSEQFNMPKVLRRANDKPLLDYVLDGINFIPQEDTIIVVGYKKEDVIEWKAGGAYKFSVQDQQLGTGHAVLCAQDNLEGYTGDVLIVYGDMPLFKQATYKKAIEKHQSTGADITMVTAVSDDKLAYGRIVRDENGKFLKSVEEKDCTEEQKQIKELNVGIYVIKWPVLHEKLKNLKTNNAQGEYYITDVPIAITNEGGKVESYVLNNSNEIYGVNTVEDLELCEKLLKEEQ